MTIDRKKLNIMQKYIYDQEEKWFLRLRPFLKQSSILKVGNGLGYMAYFINEYNPSLSVIDIDINEHAWNKDKITIYNGEHLPFSDKSFDCVICTYVLHHTSNPMQILNEMKRVSKNVVIILEETYTNLFSKLDLIHRDIYVNKIAFQSSKIHWNSYFSKCRLPEVLQNGGFKIVHHEEEKRRSYWKELYILSLDKNKESIHRS